MCTVRKKNVTVTWDQGIGKIIYVNYKVITWPTLCVCERDFWEVTRAARNSQIANRMPERERQVQNKLEAMTKIDFG